MDIEKMALVACIMDNSRIDQFALYSEIFTQEYNILCFNAMLELREQGVQFDTAKLSLYCKNNGYKIPDVYFVELLKQPNIIFYERFLEEVIEYRKNKEIEKTLQKLKTINDREQIQECIDLIVDLKQKRNVKNVITPQELTMLDVTVPTDKPRYHQTGIMSLDEVISGLYEGQLIVIAGRPGKGKTTLALQIALNLHVQSLFLSGEMSDKELYLKMLVNKAGIKQWNIEHNVLDDTQKDTLRRTQEHFQKSLKIHVYDGHFEFVKLCNLIRTHEAQVVFIDYLQRISSERENSEHLRIARITNTLKDIAREVKKPIVLLSQLNREIEKTKREPQLSDLRESGSIEADADVVIFVHEDGDRWYIKVAKNRKGKVARIDTVIFEKELSRIYDSMLVDPFTRESNEIQNSN